MWAAPYLGPDSDARAEVARLGAAGAVANAATRAALNPLELSKTRAQAAAAARYPPAYPPAYPPDHPAYAYAPMPGAYGVHPAAYAHPGLRA